jgi:antirestriction protein ArdC
MSKEIYEMVTNKIIESLNKNIVPWHKPWDCNNAPRNAKTKRAYNGINVMLLNCEQVIKSYKKNLWLTYKQAIELGGNVKKNEHSTFVIFWNFFKKDENGFEKTIPLLKYFKVFNIEQCENLKLKEDVNEKEFNDILVCEDVINNMPNKPEVFIGGTDRACYIPSVDKVCMPDKKQFHNEEGFYATFFHELVHSTGHEKRLNRKTIGTSSFGSETYSKEELVAEVGSAMLNSLCGIDSKTIEQSQAYCKSWVKKLKDDKQMIVKAASAAQKAVDFILQKKLEDKKE